MKKFITLCALFGFSQVAGKDLYDANLSDVINFSNINFDKQVTQKRDKGISIVHFYKQNGK